MSEKWKLYEYVGILQPKEAKKDEELSKEDQEARIVLGPDKILAKDDKSMQIKIHRQISENLLDDLDRLEILIRPFA